MSEEQQQQQQLRPLNFRPPSTFPGKPTHSFNPPSVEFLQGAWQVFYSTLPMWNSNKNVTITYSPHPNIPGAWDNLVRYQPINTPSSDKDNWKTVKGVEKPDPVLPAAWNWRGKGLLKVASSHWEVLGWGEEQGGWVAVWFQKTLFTPAGVDLLARRREGISEELLGRVRTELGRLGDEAVKEMAERIFAVKHD